MPASFLCTAAHPTVRAAALLSAFLLVLPQPAAAATVASVSPQGEVAQVRQVVVRFDQAVVLFGDPRLPDPVVLACSGGTPAGSGRWASDRTWQFDFHQALPPGVRCSVKLRAEWKPVAAAAPMAGRSEFNFNTGGPAVLRVWPGEGSSIEEDQHFVLQLSGAAAPASVLRQAWCEVQGIGERIAVRPVEAAARSDIIQALKLQAQTAALLVLACTRPLPGDTPMRLVWGTGIAAQANPQVLTTTQQRFDYRVRKAFTAEFSCERERANAPCLPIRPLTLSFSEPVPRLLAQQVRLQPATGAALAPVFDKDNASAEVSQIAFATPLAENARFSIELPKDVRDVSGRPLANAASFPMQVETGAAPPIAKFATAPFGILELNAEPMLPVTLRHVQADLRPGATPASAAAGGPAAPGGQLRIKTLHTPADILAWLARLRRFHESQISAREAGWPEAQWTELQADTDARGRPIQRRVERLLGTREVSLLKADSSARRMDLPQLQGGDPRPFEVVGIPLPEPGYHVLEIESARLGAALLDKAAPMFVRTGVVVTNLGLHFKHGQANSVAWVTTLDRGTPVAGAAVVVHNCNGQALWSGSTDAQGLAHIPQSLDADNRRCLGESGLFVTAQKVRATAPQGRPDTTFVFSSWQQGIEPWRFNVPTRSPGEAGGGPELRAHTVFDRTLLRAGETVSMKHFMRQETLQGLAALKPEDLPTAMKLVHEGSNQSTTVPLQWAGVRSASARWNIPPAAKLGRYRVVLQRSARALGSDANRSEAQRATEWTSGSFRVEEFRVPLVDARVVAPQAAVIAPKELALGVQMAYLSGGAMAQAPLSASALLRPRAPRFGGYDEFSFDPPREGGPDTQAPENEDGSAAARGKVVADKQALTTDTSGSARWLLAALPAVTEPSELLAEVSFNDPNGEVQTVSSTVPLWPSAVVVGIKAASWASARGQARFTVVALDTRGQPIKGQAVQVRGRLAHTISTRKRMVGGFYAYDNRTELQDLGVLCSGTTDPQGLLACDAALAHAGQVELVAQAQDPAGHRSQAAASVWVTQQGELWFAQDNDDRIDVLPEKRRYEAGETARLQVRMPFREATALVAVEREGVINTRVVTLRGNDPTVELPIDKAWGPNVYVSVLAVRGRIRQVPWTSFFSWGWKEPLNWARSFWFEGRQYTAPTATVDLSKPAFKLGVAALQVGLAAHELQVSVKPERAQYTIRQTAQVRVTVTHAGQPAAGAQVAFAAVDEGLLALQGNASWDLLNAMFQQRALSVETSTAQGEIIGRRHYGRKAVAAGGGGGRGGTRELFDTLLLWQPDVTLDANGQATVEVPLNDALTSYRLVAVADGDIPAAVANGSAAGQAVHRFGTGSASIRVTQDLQVLSGLPPLVREGDQFQALLTLRNTTARAMTVRATLAGTVNSGSAAGGANIQRSALTLAAQDVPLPPGGAQEISWPVTVPAGAFSISWEMAAQEQGAAGPGGAAGVAAAQDRVKLLQLVKAAVPINVLQATLQQLEGAYNLPVQAPANALPAQGVKAGGLVVAVQPRLSSNLPGIRRYFETYPYSCLEQKASKALALHDPALWAALTASLPTYLDSDGLAHYFPPRADEPARGSDRLTAYVLAAAHEAGMELPAAAREAMLQGLTAFVQGRIERKFWSPRADGDVRKLAAIEALSRHGRAQARLLGSVNITPQRWPTAALLDWLQIIKRLPDLPDREQRLAEAQQTLRARLNFTGTTLKFSTEADDFWWWLMDSPDANAARLVLALLDDPAWREDLPRLVAGSLARQQGGAWLTTTANLWGALALDKFAGKFEAVKVTGRTVASTAASPQTIDWKTTPEGGRLLLPWPAQAGTLNVVQVGTGKPWLTVQSLAAVPLKMPVSSGYSLLRSVTAVEQKDKNKWSRGDVLRVRLEVDAQADMSWVVLSDPVPAGATLLGSGLSRDSAIATRSEKPAGSAWAAYEERGFEALRTYFGFMPRGKHVVEYTLRLNNPGRFNLPPSRVEAMYAPESYGETPNGVLEVAP